MSDTRGSGRDPRDGTVLAGMARGRGMLIDAEVQNALGPPCHAPARRPRKADAWHLHDLNPKAGWPV